MKKTLPYPKAVRPPLNDALYSSFLQAIADLKVSMHVTDILKIPTFAKFIRDIINNKRSMYLKGQVATIMEYPFENKIPRNLGDPGIPTIYYSICNLDENNALCGVGAGVSVMPLNLYHKMNLAECMPTSITLQMAYKSTKKPVGVTENVPLRLDGHVIPTDFVILDMPEDEKLSIILGRPFLNTTGGSAGLLRRESNFQN